jgi:malate dehydrogenase (oxaloacetate-decarboxylating)(NADP+)
MPDFRQQALDYHEFPKPGKISVELTTSADSVTDLPLEYSQGEEENVRELATKPTTS